MKRILAILLIAALFCGLVPAAAADGADFADVKPGSWYYNAVAYAVDNGLMNGVGNNRFAPDAPMNRAMLVTVLWRFSGSPEEGENIFTDLKEPWYMEAVAWAAENGVVTGVGNGKFDPNGTVTREQLAAVLYRYSLSLQLPADARAQLGSFPDANKVSSWSQEALSWAVAEGLITGSQVGSKIYLQPQGSATRAQVATILMRYMEGFYLQSSCPHTDIVLRNDRSATCTIDGYTGDLCCVVCGYCVKKGESISKYNHNFVDGICDRCGESENAESLVVAGKGYHLGMSEAELLALAGNPEEKLPSVEGCTWYVYGTKTYKDFFMAGIYNGVVVSLCSTGVGFTYRGQKMGQAVPDVTGSECRMRVCTDCNDKNIFYAVKLTSMSFWMEDNYSAKNLAGDSKANFHLTNAFRVYHGKDILLWSDAAATAARLHCEDMASQDYFDHFSLDGRSPGDRMMAQGIRCIAWGENICAGCTNGFDAYDAWVNSKSHRDGMLNTMSHLGVGFAAKSDATYLVYAGQNYFAAQN